MRVLTQIILLFIFLYSTELAAKNSIHTELAYFFQDTGPNQPISTVFEKDLELFIETLKEDQSNSNKKNIDRITKEIEKKYFKIPKTDADLGGFLVFGQHNALTVTAIQAIVLGALDIPYQIKEHKEGLGLIAYPESDKIPVQYSGKQSLIPWTDNSKTEAVNYLIKMDVIERSDANRYGFDLVDKFFKKQRDITLKELAGLDLMKKAVLAIDAGKHLKAVDLLKIGHDSYSDIRFNYLLFGAMELAIDEMTFDNILIMDYMLQIYNLTRKQASLDRLKSNVNHVYYVALNERRDFAFTDSAKVLIMENLKRYEDQNKLMSDFLCTDMFYYYTKNDKDKTFECALSGLEYNPNNLEIQNVFGAIVIDGLFGQLALYDEEDIELVVDRMDSLKVYIAKYPFLKEDETIGLFYITVKSAQVSDAFQRNQKSNGEELLAELEHFLINYDFEDKYVNEQIASAFSDVGNYFYRQKDYEKALEWTEKALEIDPESESIKRRKTYIEDKLN